MPDQEPAQQIRAGVIGCGQFMRLQHIQTIARSDSLTLAHLSDRDPQAVEEVARRYPPGRTSTDWREVVGDPEVDVVVAGVAPTCHPEIARAAIEAGKPIYIEKPLAETLAEAVGIRRLAAGRKVPLAVGFNRRFAPAIKLIKRAFAERGGAASMLYRISDDDRVNPPARSWKDRDRLLIEVVHIFDLLAWLIGTEPVQVFGTEGRYNDTVVSLRYTDGSCASILSSPFGSLAQPKEHFEAILDRAGVEMDDFVEVRTYGLKGVPERAFFAGRSFDDLDNSHVDAFARRGLDAFGELRRRYNRAMSDSGVLADSGNKAAWDRAAELLGDPPPPQINYCCDKGWAEALEGFCLAALARQTPDNADAADACRATACAAAARESIEKGQPIQLDPHQWRD